MALQLPRGRLKPQKTIPVTLEGVCIPPDSGKSVVLHIRYAGRANEGYFNAQVATAEAKAEGGAAAQANASDLRLAKIYAEHVIESWDNVSDADGPVKYTPELGLEVLTWLIAEEQRPEKFRFVAFQAQDPTNFENRGPDPAAVGEA
jgi:hypothetical protein